MMRLLFFLILFLFATYAWAQLSKVEIDSIEQILSSEMSRQHIPGLSIAIVVDTQLVWSNGYGMADLENYVPAKATTKYRTASIGKPMTATAILQLVEKGVIDLDAPIQQYCTAFPKKKWDITTRHILTHQSGIRHYDENNLEAELYSTKHYNNVIEALDIFKNDTLLFKPGTDYLYSTYAYNVLGCVIEGASGKSYLDYMQQAVFQIAGMNHTLADDPSEIISNRASGYILTEEGALQNSRMVDMSNKLPAGGFLTTAEDLAKFCVASMKGKLLSPAMFSKMITHQPLLATGVLRPFGFGWALNDVGDEFYGLKEVFHGGGTPQVSNMVYMLPEKGFAVILLTNRENVENRVGITESIAKVVLNLGK